jgi:hypothetical protein
MRGADNPQAWNSEITRRSVASAGTSRIAPGKSKRRSPENVVVRGTISQPRSVPRMANGTVTQKIQRQPSAPKSTPPSAGPMLRPTA